MAYLTVAELREYLGIEETTTFTADAGTDNLTLASVPFVDTLQTATAVVLTTTNTLPAPLALATTYYVILVADQVIQLATSSANATAGTQIDITDAGLGTHTITRTPSETDLLTEAISDAESTVNAQTNRVFEASASTTRYFRREDILDWNSSVLWINDDLLTVTELLNADSANTEIVAANYWLLDRNAGPPYHAIELLSGTGISWQFDVDQWVSVTGTWGYSTTVPADVKRATTRLAAFYYKQKDSQVFETTAIPEAGVITIPAGLERTFERLVEKYKRYIR